MEDNNNENKIKERDNNTPLNNTTLSTQNSSDSKTEACIVEPYSIIYDLNSPIKLKYSLIHSKRRLLKLHSILKHMIMRFY